MNTGSSSSLPPAPNLTSTNSSTSPEQKYPNYPPYDSQIVFYQSSSLKISPNGPDKNAKICPKCQYPILIRMVIKPCMHYLCYECYQYNRNECGYCSSVACEVERLPDRATMFSCDIQCYKVFGSMEELNKHFVQHAGIKAVIAGNTVKNGQNQN